MLDKNLNFYCYANSHTLYICGPSLAGVNQEANIVPIISLSTKHNSHCDGPEPKHVFQGCIYHVRWFTQFAIVALQWEKHLRCMDSELRMSTDL